MVFPILDSNGSEKVFIYTEQYRDFNVNPQTFEFDKVYLGREVKFKFNTNNCTVALVIFLFYIK